MKKLFAVAAALVFFGTLAAQDLYYVTLDPGDPTPVSNATVTAGDTFYIYAWITVTQNFKSVSVPLGFTSPIPSPMWVVDDADSMGLYEPFTNWTFYGTLHGWDDDTAEMFWGGVYFFGVEPPGTYLIGWAKIAVDPNFTGEVTLDKCIALDHPGRYMYYTNEQNQSVVTPFNPVTFTVQSAGPPVDTLHVASYGDTAHLNIPTGSQHEIWFMEPGTRGPSVHIVIHNITAAGDLTVAVFNNAYPNTINSINKYWYLDFTGTADSYDLDFYYLDTDVPAGLDETQFHAWYLDHGVPQWVDMGGTPDAVNNQVTGVNTTHLSEWTLGPPGVTGVEEGNQIPRVFFLNQNAPNPFRGRTTIAFGLPKAADVSLVIYNAAGQKVRTLVSGHKEAGTYTVTWDGRNDAGQPVAAGAYFYKFQAGEYQSLKKMLLLK